MDNSRTIFVVGFPRSGTTFLQSLLATQKGVLSFPETHFYSILTGHLNFVKGVSYDEFEDMVARADRYLLLDEDVKELWKLYDTNTELNRKELFETVLSILAERQNTEFDQASIILEKTPSHAFHLEKILLDHPEARFIQIIRHPVDAIASYMRHLTQGKKDLGQVIREWTRSYESVEDFRSNHPQRILTVAYEDLSNDYESEMIRVCDFLSIELDKELLRTYPEKASELIMPYENWKSSNRKAKFNGESYDLSVKEKAEVQLFLRTRMEQQGYKVRNKFFQMFYDLKNRRVL